jgi:hypothetical protein
MWYFILLLMSMTVLISCGNAQKLLDRTTADKGRIIVKKGLFSGIDYIYVQKRIDRKIKYKLFYDCECGIENKISLRKDYVNDRGQITAWTAVTDTSGQIKFFEEEILENRLYIPTNFMPITQEEISVLTDGLNKVDKECCKNEKKPIERIIGFIRVKLN